MLLTTNPFTELSQFVPAFAQQAYVIAMAILVVVGTMAEVISKGSAKYFFKKWKEDKQHASRKVSGGEMASMAVKVALNEVSTAAEFANPQRRMSHFFTMWGFILFVLSSAVMVFGYPGANAATPAIWPLLWHLSALALCFGGYWFWFFIRVDVSSEGHPWYRLEKADLFIVSLLAMATFALLWSFTQYVDASAWSMLFLGLFLIASTVLFGTVLWSKFAHMFFKPAAAFEKRYQKAASGSYDNLPYLTRDDPEQRKRHSMELLRDAPMDMGLGIKREPPQHY